MMKIRSIALTFVSGLLCVGCTQKAQTEAISVSPVSINAGQQMASYPVEITCSTSWTASISGTASEWISLPTSGQGSGSVSLRVMKNPFKDRRSAVVEFSTPGGVRATLDVVQEGDTQAHTVKMTVRLGTYNLRIEQKDEADDNKWAVRKDRLAKSIGDNNMDVFGVQEVNTAMQSWLKTTLGSSYTCYFFSPYSQNGSGDKAQGILFKTKDFEQVKSGFFWACSTPDVMTENDRGDQGNFKRGGCWLILKHKSTGIEFFFMNNHGCLNQAANTENAPYYKQIEQKYNADALPSFFVGDMNARPTYEATTIYKQHWKDSYEYALKKSGPENTYNGFSSPGGKYRLDYIFYRGSGISPDSHCVNNQLYGGLYASDHFPVYLDATITK